MQTDAERLAASPRGYLIAPAGFGKTYLVSEAVTDCCDGRELLLTHTHAGVRAIRNRLHQMNCPNSRFRVDTISGWALRFAQAYPVISGVSPEPPSSSNHWRRTYKGAVQVLNTSAIAQVIRASYTGVFVDEYQDCTLNQHRLILRLAELLPCRVVGDPLQSIFDFEDDPLDWKAHVAAHYESLGELTTPHRWLKTNIRLGEWLLRVRELLECGAEIDLSSTPEGVYWRSLSARAQYDSCHQAADRGGTVTAIHEGTREQPCHHLARQLGGRFQSMEPIECKDLYTYARRIEQASGGQRAVLLLEFAGLCLTAVKSKLKTTSGYFRYWPPTSQRRRPRKYVTILDHLEAVANTTSLAPIPEALDAIRDIGGAGMFRRELWRSFRQALAERIDGDAPTLFEAAWRVREILRHAGRRPDPCVVSRTLLVKGLEFDHAVVLDADSLDSKQLYVALTRGSRTLTILSEHPVLSPRTVPPSPQLRLPI